MTHHTDPLARPQSILRAGEPSVGTMETLRLPGGDVTTRFYPRLDHTVNQDELQFVRGMMARVLPMGSCQPQQSLAMSHPEV